MDPPNFNTEASALLKYFEFVAMAIAQVSGTTSQFLEEIQFARVSGASSKFLECIQFARVRGTTCQFLECIQFA